MPTRTRHDLSADAWLHQAERDLHAADHLLSGGFFPHATVIAHLAVEKALKGTYRARLGRNPPVTHNLQHLAERIDLTVPADLREALDLLSDESILRLYPDRLFQDAPDYDRDHARERVAAAHALLNWITDQV
ncbi:MAG: HEPN domain-containing protein [Bacteroidetes bacterium]|jgi:HEPN domain-containing protein|nr:HEPN domain-containing protein [Bacteroidota bacterium]